jgi:hypothetical protein
MLHVQFGLSSRNFLKSFSVFTAVDVPMPGFPPERTFPFLSCFSFHGFPPKWCSITVFHQGILECCGGQWQLMESSCGMGSSVGLGSNGGSLVATPDCKPVIPGLNPATSPACSGLPVLRWVCRQGWYSKVGCPLRGSRGE